MKRHDDPFYEMFREGLQGYEATPPAGAHAAIKQRMAKGSFFHFAWNRLNVYYAALLLGAGLAGAFVLNEGGAATGQSAMVPHVNSELVLSAVQNRLVNQHVDAEIDDLDYSAMASAETTVKTGSKRHASTMNPSHKADPSATTPDVAPAELNPVLSSTENNISVECQEVASSMEAMTQLNQAQLPIDWMNHLKSPNLTSLLNQLDSENETIRLKLPVTVTVEK